MTLAHFTVTYLVCTRRRRKRAACSHLETRADRTRSTPLDTKSPQLCRVESRPDARCPLPALPARCHPATLRPHTAADATQQHLSRRAARSQDPGPRSIKTPAAFRLLKVHPALELYIGAPLPSPQQHTPAVAAAGGGFNAASDRRGGARERRRREGHRYLRLCRLDLDRILRPTS